MKPSDANLFARKRLTAPYILDPLREYFSSPSKET